MPSYVVRTEDSCPCAISVKEMVVIALEQDMARDGLVYGQVVWLY